MKYAPFLLLLAATPAAAQPADAPPDWRKGVTDVILPESTTGEVTLTLDKAVAIAMQQQPSLREARANVEAAKGRVDQARVVEHPTVSVAATLGTGSTRNGGPGTGTGMMIQTTTGGFFTPGLASGLSATAAYRIYDFGLTHANVKAAELTADATEATISTTTLDVRKDVESAYLEAVARERLVRVAQSTVASEEGHFDQAKRFVAAGAQDPIAVAQAQSRLANAKSALAQAQSTQAIALANLRAAIGWVELQQAIVVDPNWPTPPTQEPQALAVLVSDARAHRPEIIQFDKQIAASDASVTAAQAERRPILAATASVAEDYDYSSNTWESSPSWQAGITLSWALFDGGRSAADVRIANANRTSTQAQRDALLVSLTSQLDSARSQIFADKANVSASTEAVTAARAELQLAEARYTQGLGSQIELADAQTAVTTAEGNLVTAEWQLADAWAQLRRALGQT